MKKLILVLMATSVIASGAQARGFFDTIGHAFAHDMKDIVSDVGHGIKNGFVDVGEGIVFVGDEMMHGIADAAVKFGEEFEHDASAGNIDNRTDPDNPLFEVDR